MENFKKAILTGLRFKSSKGPITTEDVSVLRDSTLRDMANEIHRDLTKSSEDIFAVKSKACEEQTLRLDILKDIIKTREDAVSEKVSAAEVASHNAEIDRRIKANNDKALDNMSNEELEKLRK